MTETKAVLDILAVILLKSFICKSQPKETISNILEKNKLYVEHLKQKRIFNQATYESTHREMENKMLLAPPAAMLNELLKPKILVGLKN